MTESIIGPYRLSASRMASAAGHEYAAVEVDTGTRVLLTVLESLAAVDGPDGEPNVALQSHYQQVMGRLGNQEHELLGMPSRVSPPTSERYWYVSPMTDGTPLRRHLDHRGPFGWRTVALLLHEICVTLGFAHHGGVAHGNLEPGTVLVEPSGAIRLVRPDVAGRVVFRHEGSATISLAALWDEPIYLAPEVLSRSAPTPADDVYSLGVLAFVLLTGRLPYSSPSEVLSRAQSRRSAPDPGEIVQGVPPALRRLVRSMMAPRAAIRTPSAAELRKAIREQVLPDMGPNDGRSDLIAAMRARITGSNAPHTPAPPPSAPEEQVLASSSEALIDTALHSAGMTRATRSPPRSGPSRGMWFAVGLALVVAGVIVAMRAPQTPLTTPPPPPPQELASSPSSPASAPAKGVVPPGHTVVQAKSPPVDPMEVARAKAEALIGSRQHRLAVRILRAALERGDDEDGALGMLLGQALAEQGQLKEAVVAYINADGSTRTEGHMRAGVLVAIDGRCPEALPLFLEVAARREPTSAVFKHVGNCQLIVGDAKAAVETLRRAQSMTPEDLDVVVPLAQSLEAVGELAGALEMFRRALEIKPTARRARAGVTRLAGALGTTGSSRPEGQARQGAASEDVDAGALQADAHAAFRSGKFATASRLYGEAVKALGDEVPALLLRNRAIAMHKAGQGLPAIRAYQAALVAAPEDAELHYLMGTLMASEGKHGRASRALQAALDREPERWKARFELGMAELRQGRHRQAAEAFAAVTRQRPQERSAWQNLVKARTESGDQEGALSALGRMHQAHPKDPQTLLTMASLLQTMDRDDEATALLSEACSKGIEEACQ